MENEISGSSSAGTGDGSRDLNYDSGTRGDHGGEIQKTRSPMYKMYIRDKHDYDDPFMLLCTYESVSGDRNVLFLLSMSSNKCGVVRYLELV
jgi:hypothetical protein